MPRLLITIILFYCFASTGKSEKVCLGTGNGLSLPANLDQHYSELSSRYANCTHIIGNLEIVGFDKERDLSFLKDVQEISGYLLIGLIKLDIFPLHNLVIIRGNTLYEESYALYIINTRISELQFISLKEIQMGNVYIGHNYRLCYINTIDWYDLFPVTDGVSLNSREVKLEQSGCRGSWDFTCPDGMEECKNGRCIPPGWICDGLNDCGDFSDESFCSQNCIEKWYHCDNGRCIKYQFVCDGINDCGDASDEKCDPALCPEELFACNNGKCIDPSQLLVCNSLNDCGDFSDETDCSMFCSDRGWFFCNNGRCIHSSLHCDGDDQCGDNSDEEDCSAYCISDRGSFYCNNSRCIDSFWRCDGTDDCGDNSDEEDCSSEWCASDIERFLCKNNVCGYSYQRCDGNNNCGDNSDEENCFVYCSDRGLLVCNNNSSCLTSNDLCDGFNDCGDNSDEEVCSTICTSDMFACNNNGRCISSYERCDGWKNCEDNSDEEDCSAICTSDNERFLCNDGRCIGSSWLCNGDKNCEDGSDEDIQLCNATAACLENCDSGCWGAGPKMCQILTRKNCHPVCEHRCNGTAPEDCCHSSCAAGCTGPTNGDCLACQKFNDEGKCVDDCSSPANTSLKEPNTNLKYMYGSKCVKKCPENYFIDNYYCVQSCPSGKFAYDYIQCVECEGPCPVVCKGTDSFSSNNFVRADNIDTFENCYEIDGNLVINDILFKGNLYYGISKLDDVSKLEYFSQIRRITGYLSVKASGPSQKNLSMFQNLKYISGQQLYEDKYALVVSFTKLEMLGLRSLREITHGSVLIQANENMCYLNENMWKGITKNPTSSNLLKDNKASVECSEEGRDCHEGCTSEGCWGPGSNMCISCRNYTLGDECMETCNTNNGQYLVSSTECAWCDVECDGNCTGAGPGNCIACKHVTDDGPYCRDECPLNKYPNSANNCTACHPNCIDGCTGPANTLGEGGCNKCRKILLDREGNITKCDKDIASCPDNTFIELSNEAVLSGLAEVACKECHDQCLSCQGPSDADCTQCLNKTLGDTCVEECPIGTSSDENGICQGGISNGERISIIVGTTFAVTLLITVIIIVIYLKKRKHLYKIPADYPIEQLDLQALAPSGAAPNASSLKLIKETELKKGNVLGSGAFGTVIKGLWTPEGERICIPVAIKVLKEGMSAESSKELLEEAYVMATIIHPCLVRLLCVCMAQQMMMITQLMPCGSLLEYLRDNKDKISSHHLLTWCTQIAHGMEYLEEMRLVHRDLAARNILVKNPAQVKITDFGLSKFLDIQDKEYMSDGGKIAVKWMAPECIKYRKFTHKSDVWSFGITVWELMTFGWQPFRSVRLRDVVNVLEKGERPAQPQNCSIEVYMVMIKCWLSDADARPSFTELAEEFCKMTKDPQRYLISENKGRVPLPCPTKLEFYESLAPKGDHEILMDAEEYLQPVINDLGTVSEEAYDDRALDKGARTLPSKGNNTITNTGDYLEPVVTATMLMNPSFRDKEMPEKDKEGYLILEDNQNLNAHSEQSVSKLSDMVDDGATRAIAMPEEDQEGYLVMMDDEEEAPTETSGLMESPDSNQNLDVDSEQPGYASAVPEPSSGYTGLIPEKDQGGYLVMLEEEDEDPMTN